MSQFKTDGSLTHSNWFLHPVEGPQRLRRWVIYIWEFLLFALRKNLGIEPLVHSLNIGGGPRWCKSGWRNLEEVQSYFNPESFALSSTCIFPYRDDSIQTVYSSHCFEHLPDETVKRCFEETARVLKSGGEFMIKIPDFDEILTQWLADNDAYFSDYRFNFNSMRHTWLNRSIEVGIDFKAAFSFCCFWNDAYGNHYSKDVHHNAESYFGAPLISSAELRKLAQSSTPHAISANLKKRVLKDEPSVHFAHQNAWSRRELHELLTKHGFQVQTTSTSDLKKRFRSIPGFDAMECASLFCLATKQ